jgi:tRNA A-37 threonylcarbamoyl transferase component Bud32
MCRSSVEVPSVSGTASGGDAGQETAGGTIGKPSPNKSSTDKALGRFEIQGVLGEGAFGKVYQARDPQLDRQVAIKVPRLGVLGTREEAQRFLREARAAANLRHPHIVPIYDAGEVEGTYYIASAFIEGQTLRAWMRETGKVDPLKAARLIEPLATALHYAHEQGVVHRDIKPDNVLLDKESVPHIADFGLARREDGAALRTQEGVRMGTPAYMSPEQHEGRSHQADGRSDLWALGVILYEMLTGERPFQGDQVRIAYAVMQLEPTPPRRLEPNTPADLETICLKCLVKEPDGRYANCQELAEDLQRWRQDEPIHARRVGKLEQAWKWARRQPLLASLAAAVTLLAIVSTITALQFLLAWRSTVSAFEREQTQVALARKETDRAKEKSALARERETAAKQSAELAKEQEELVQRESESAAQALSKLQAEVDARRQAEEARDAEAKKRGETAGQLQQTEMALAKTSSAADEAKKKSEEAARRSEQLAKEDPMSQYGAALTAADAAIAAGNWPDAERHLEACPAWARAWEWNYLKGLADHRTNTKSVSIASNAFGLSDLSTVVIAVGPNAAWIAAPAGSGTASNGRRYAIFQLPASKPIAFVNAGDRSLISISPNARFVVLRSKNKLTFHELANERELDFPNATDVLYSANGDWVVVSRPGEAIVVALASPDWFKTRTVLPAPVITRKGFRPNSVTAAYAFSPEGDLTAFYKYGYHERHKSENDLTPVLRVSRWMLNQGVMGPLVPQEMECPAPWLTFGFDGAPLVSGGNKLIVPQRNVVFDAEERKVLWTNKDLPVIALTPDSRRILAFTGEGESAELYDVATHRSMPRLGSLPWLNGVSKLLDAGQCLYLDARWTRAVVRSPADNGIKYYEMPTFAQSAVDSAKQAP